MNKSIVVNGITYVPMGTTIVAEHSGEYKIVVLQRGWVLIGKFERKGNDCKLHKASVIRNWGTTKGLGELAQDGPKPSTILDKCYGLVEFDYLTMVVSLSVNGGVWINVL